MCIVYIASAEEGATKFTMRQVRFWVFLGNTQSDLVKEGSCLMMSQKDA